MSRPGWWKLGARVIVREVGAHGETTTLAVPARGTVVRLLMRNSREAWVDLDKRLEGDEERLHGFPADDDHGRALHVSTDCDSCRPEYLEVVG